METCKNPSVGLRRRVLFLFGGKQKKRTGDQKINAERFAQERYIQRGGKPRTCQRKQNGRWYGGTEGRLVKVTTLPMAEQGGGGCGQKKQQIDALGRPVVCL